jgi:hypothetical protein
MSKSSIETRQDREAETLSVAEQILSKRHRQELEASGLSTETIRRCGFYSATAEQVKVILGFKAGPGLAIPYQNLNGKNDFIRIKPDIVFLDRYGRPSKYLSPKGAGNRIYIPPHITPEQLSDPKIPLYVTEGEKKALKASQEGLCCIAIPGVWSWKQKKGNRSVPIPDLDLVEWKNRSVCLVFDSDLRAKKEVATALYELSRELEKRRANVRKIDLQDGPGGAKVGLDDYLVAHSVEAFYSLSSLSVLPPEYQYIEVTPVTEFVRRILPNREAIIGRGILYPKGKMGLTGGGKKGKSMLLQNLLLSLAAGVSFIDFPVPKPRRVVLIQSEVSPWAMQDRLKRMIAGRADQNPQFENALLVNAPNLKIDTKDGYRAIKMILEQSRAEVVGFDPLYRLHSSDENKTNEMRSVVDLFERLIEEYGVSLILSHHHGKATEGRDEGQLARGSTIFGDWVDSQIVIRGHGKTAKRNHIRHLSFILRNDVEPDPIDVVLNPETLWFEQQVRNSPGSPDASKAIQSALAILARNELVNVTSLQREIGVSKPTARRLLRLLPSDTWESFSGPRSALCYRRRPKNQGASDPTCNFHRERAEKTLFPESGYAKESTK